MIRSLILVCVVLLPLDLFSQNISINAEGMPPDPSAILDISSTSKGLLIPRMTLAERDLINNPAAGLLIYQNDSSPGLYMYNGIAWHQLTSTSNVWSTGGNAGLDSTTHFIGTTDKVPLLFKYNNHPAAAITYRSASFGRNALALNQGFENTAFGNDALKSMVFGYRNLAVGNKALSKINNSDFNLAIGNNAMKESLSGHYNIALGHDALNGVSGGFNIAIGIGAMLFTTTGSSNIAIGEAAMGYNTTGIENVAIGRQGLLSNTSGYDNTTVGTYSMYYNTTGSGNTAIGRAALQGGNGSYNTAVGYKSLFGNRNGYKNTGIGFGALENNYDGQYNVAIGADALKYNYGSENVAVGSDCMRSNTFGQLNAALGNYSLDSNTSGNENVAMGIFALTRNTTGNYNVAVGSGALSESVNTSYNVAVGYNSGPVSSLYNTVSIGNSGYLNGNHSQAFFGNTSHTWNGGNVMWSTYSDARIKTDIREEVVGLDFIKRLRPVTYHRDIDIQATLTGNKPLEDFPHKYDIEKIKFSGFLAQEVEAAAEASGYEFSGITRPANDQCVYTLSYESFVVPLIKAVQEQQAMIELLSEKIRVLEERDQKNTGMRQTKSQ